MSLFADVDGSGEARSLIARLDQLDQGLAAMKAYMAAAIARAVPGGLVVDLGCGAGHDVARMAAAGLRALGVDRSAAMLDETRARASGGTALVRADGAGLPFRDASVDGCRMERVLQHVAEPSLVLAEAARVVRPGGILAVFEPDWTTIRVDPPLEGDGLASAIADVRHPDVGGRLVALARAAGFDVDDEVVERSQAGRLAALPWTIDARLSSAVEHGRLDARTAERWVAELHEREQTGTLRVHWSKVLVVATRRSR
jgi:SAM-dependent methyltransferase